MKLPLRIRPEAHQELLDACEWHENAKSALGSELKREIYAQLERIQQNPMLYRKAHGNIRCVKVRRFRYQIIYEILEEHLEIYAFFHTSRNPKIWKRRAKKTS
jgi:plasmid stabilization system protein ParE